MLTRRKNTSNYRQLFLSGAPLIDLRAPCEFIQGAFPNATSLPLMTDDERVQVGTCYKQQGQEAAIRLGHKLVGGETKAKRLQLWCEFIRKHPEGFLYCFRGGLRSKTVQQWLAERQLDYPLVIGGYKAMRRFLIEQTIEICSHTPMYLISGLTGVGKTRLMANMTHTVDLEHLANHRGSSFGRQLTQQPTQINFENSLAIELLKLDARKLPFMLLEDEARLIGSRSIPLEMHRLMKQAPLIILQATTESRVENILQEYVIERTRLYQLAGVNCPETALRAYLLTAIKGIARRLGEARHQRLQQIIMAATQGSPQTAQAQHREWIHLLLNDYYDPMYQYQLAKKQQRIIFQGDAHEVRQFVENLATQNASMSQ